MQRELPSKAIARATKPSGSSKPVTRGVNSRRMDTLWGPSARLLLLRPLGQPFIPVHTPHDAFDANGDIQIKMIAGKRVAMYACCNRLVVLQIVSSVTAEIVYDGPGEPVWNAAAPMGKNGQRSISVARLKSMGRSVE